MTHAAIRQCRPDSRSSLPTRVLRAGLLLVALLSPLPATTYAQDADSVSPEQIEALKEQIADIDDWLKDAEADRGELEQTLASTERKIGQLKKERRSLRQQAAEQQTEIDKLKDRERKLEKELAAKREALKAQIRAAWMAGDAPALKVLLNEIDPQKLSRVMTYHEYLSKDTVSRLEAFNRTLDDLKTTREQSIAAQLKLKKTEAAVAERQDKLEDQHKTRERTLALLKSDISDKKGKRQDLVADRERLEKLLKEVEAAIADIPTPKESQPFSSLRAKLPWPTRGKVIIGYGESLHNGRLRHNGLLIAAQPEAEVKAVHYGRVVFANWLRGFGLLTIIDHGDGYMSLYGRNSSLLKSPGEWVRAGETIAIAGEGDKDSSARLYFEIRHNGKPQNPMRWLAHK
ncbi:peptidase M23 [Marinobacter sp. R17]|uniref:murein hydrolase activator EnvC family protein n=1 Tax=Marinobacter sp. R17 TaxID=2484250 RepID=UPI000F4B6DF1|nr:peptidoglycan DD-metalloendopeptidase family protein [Marinobacter sp. R17]ROT98703.1 peptidase M23 [Marinobacter sp. R17]